MKRTIRPIIQFIIIICFGEFGRDLISYLFIPVMLFAVDWYSTVITIL